MLQVMKATLSEQDQRVEDALIAMGVTYDVTYRGERTDSEKWTHDEWLFDLKRHEGGLRQPVAEMSQQYRTGTGHRKFPPGAITPRPPYTPNTIAWVDWQNTKRAVKPAIAGLLHSVLSDVGRARRSPRPRSPTPRSSWSKRAPLQSPSTSRTTTSPSPRARANCSTRRPRSPASTSRSPRYTLKRTG